MKIALYIEDGVEQIVLTPQTDYEKKMLALLHDQTRVVEIKDGSCYECNGGYVRHGYVGGSYYDSTRNADNSTMLVLRRKVEEEATE
jgi:hypothetical protein